MKEQERQAQYVFVYFYVLCHHHFINFTPQRYTLSFYHFCCFYSINHHYVFLNMKDIYPSFVVRHSGSQVLTFHQIHGPQLIKILIHTHTPRSGLMRVECGNYPFVISSHFPINSRGLCRCWHGLILCIIWFRCHIYIVFHAAKVRIFFESAKLFFLGWPCCFSPRINHSTLTLTIFFDSSSVVVRLLSAFKADNKRTTNGQQANIWFIW